MDITITKSNKEGKKLMAVINNKKTVHFGQEGASDFTKHKDEDRKQLYINRHKKREDHSKSGINTSGFYARHILWSEPTIEQSINKLNKKYKDVNFTYLPHKK